MQIKSICHSVHSEVIMLKSLTRLLCVKTQKAGRHFEKHLNVHKLAHEFVNVWLNVKD